MTEIEFGTDGIRGPAGKGPLTSETLEKIGMAVSCLLNEESSGKVIIGRDTRESGQWIMKALSKGLCKGGATVLDGGIMPTAAVSCALSRSDAVLGIAITASHNPWQDNGLKFFEGSGKKLSDDNQTRLSKAYKLSTQNPTKPGKVQPLIDPLGAWREMLPRPKLNGMKIMLDCAHGAGAKAAPAFLSELGCELVVIGCEPDGRNINENVGALHPPSDLKGCDLAICLDGDADRLILIDTKNGVMDGDDMLWLLRDSTDTALIGTIMSNGGLESALGEKRLLRSKVGDRNVAALMKSSGATIGAEPSGHVLFSDGMPTGDGLYTALKILEQSGHPPFNLNGWKRWPVSKRNIAFEGDKINLDSLTQIKKAEAAGQRTVVRYSGTESKLRVMVEGKDSKEWLERICSEFNRRTK